MVEGRLRVWCIPESASDRGRYLDQHGSDLTGQHFGWGCVAVSTAGSLLEVAPAPPCSPTGYVCRVNLMRAKTGWRWLETDQADLATLISLEYRAQHWFAASAVFHTGLLLERLAARSEPRLRPRSRGFLRQSGLMGTIWMRGRIRPVYHHLEISGAP